MSKITISLGGKDYDIKLDGEFALKFEDDFKEQFKGRSTIDPKELLYAYVGKCYDNFLLEQEVSSMLEKVEKV